MHVPPNDESCQIIVEAASMISHFSLCFRRRYYQGGYDINLAYTKHSLFIGQLRNRILDLSSNEKPYVVVEKDGCGIIVWFWLINKEKVFSLVCVFLIWIAQRTKLQRRCHETPLHLSIFSKRNFFHTICHNEIDTFINFHQWRKKISFQNYVNQWTDNRWFFSEVIIYAFSFYKTII